MTNGIIISGEKGIIESLELVLSGIAGLRRARCVREAVEEGIRHPADFVILDSCTGDMEPSEAVRRLLRIQSSLPVIVIVPSRHLPLAEEVTQIGAYAVLESPFDARDIVDLVRRAVEKKRLAEELEYLRAGGAKSDAGDPLPEVGESVYFYREVVRRFFKAVSQVFDYGKLLQLAIEAVTETFSVGKAAIFLLDQKSGKYAAHAYAGYSEEFIASKSFEASDALPAWLVTHSRILSGRDISAPERFELYRQVKPLEAELITGLCAKGRLIGFVSIGMRVTGKEFSDNDLELLSLLTNYLAMAIENARLYGDIARSRLHNEKVLNHLKTGVITIDSRGRVTTVNSAAESILEIEREAVMGERVEKIGSLFADIMLRTMAGEVEYTRREISSPVGRKPLEVSTSVMRDQGGGVDGAIMVFTDLSRIKVLEEKERDLERLEFWSAMAARLAHEVKNPLVPIKTFAQLLPERYKDEEFRGRFCEIVNGEVERLNGIITRLTKFADHTQPEMKPTDLHKVIESAIRTILTKSETKKAKLLRKFSKGEIVARADAVLLAEALANILDNAVEALEEGGTITVSTALKGAAGRNNGTFEIVIEDDGEGISEEELNDIFTPFVSTKTNGMGLGLPIARRIVADHRGTIRVRSAPGRGTAVTIEMPVEAE